MSTSTTPKEPDVRVGFKESDLAVARIMVRRLVRAGYRKGPTDYLILTDSSLDQWFNEEAVRWLHEQGKTKQGGALEIG